MSKTPSYKDVLAKDIAKKYGEDKNVMISGAELKKRKRVIIPVSPSLDLALGGGLVEGTWNIFSGPPKCGKEQPLTATVYTPNGPKTMGDIKVGDIVLTPDGSSDVIAVFDNGLKDIYKVEFENGDVVECGYEHLWEVIDKADNQTKVLELNEILSGGILHNYEPRWEIKTPRCEFAEKKFAWDVTEFVNFLDERPVFITQDALSSALYSSINIREDILEKFNSLCDSTTSKKQIANFIKNIAQSLGYVAKIERFSSRECEIGEIGIQYKVLIDKNTNVRKIVDIKFHRQSPAKCIKLRDERGLYITDNFIVTHNTVTALQTAANAQRLYNKHVYYLNVETRLKPRDLEGIHGLQSDEDNLTILQSDTGAILYASDFLQYAMNIIKGHPGCVLIIDSASALCAESEASKEISANSRNEGPKLLASFCRQMAGVVPAQDTTVIIIQHLIANTSGYGAPYMEDGGRKILYQCDTKIRCKGVQKWLEGEKQQIGNILNWEIVNSSIGPPGKTAESYLRFGHGLDEEMELVMVGADLGLIGKAGAWYYPEWLVEDEAKARLLVPSLKDETDVKKPLKFCGQEKFKAFLLENPKVKQDLFDSIKKIS